MALHHIVIAIDAILAVLATVLFSYRAVTARANRDFVQLCAMVEYGVALTALSVAVVLFRNFNPIDYDPTVALFWLSIFALAPFLLRRYEFRILASLGALTFVIDPKNSLLLNVFFAAAFVISAFLGLMFGSWLFRRLFDRRLGVVVAQRVVREAKW